MPLRDDVVALVREHSHVPMSRRELYVAGWSAELALEFIEEALGRTCETYLMARGNVPRWRLVKRLRLRRAYLNALLLCNEVGRLRRHSEKQWDR